MFSNPEDPPSVSEVRKQERAWMERWIKEAGQKVLEEARGQMPELQDMRIGEEQQRTAKIEGAKMPRRAQIQDRRR